MANALDMKLEVISIPVSDVDRAIRFYTDLGWRLDADFIVGNEFRGVQVTPPGSSCSVQFGKGISSAEPGSAKRMFLVVSDIEAARANLIEHGAQVSEIFHGAPGQPPSAGRDPEGHSYASLATFNDPDGNMWLLQEVTQRLPGRVDPTDTRYTSHGELVSALRRAETAHGEHEKRTGVRDQDWPTWYAEYMVNEQAGKELPT